MTQTQTSPDNQAKVNAGIAALAAAQLAQLWPQVDWASPDAVNAVKTVYNAIVTQFGQASASRAAEFYDDVRAAQNVKQAFRAIPADPVPQVVTDKAVESAFLGNPATDQPVLTPTTSDLPVEQRVPARLDDSLQRHVIQPARDTIAENAAADPANPRYIRVPSGATTCAFCVMLASREIKSVKGGKNNFTGYASKQSAQFVVGRGIDATPRGNQPIGEKYHNHCDCQPVAIFPDQSAADVSPNFYDYQDMYYKATADAGTSRDTKKILASMRQLHGLK